MSLEASFHTEGEKLTEINWKDVEMVTPKYLIGGTSINTT